MRELFSESDFRDDARKTAGVVMEFLEAYEAYSRDRSSAARHQHTDPSVFASMARWCEKNNVPPVFVVHAVFEMELSDRVAPFVFRTDKALHTYQAWADTIPAELPLTDITTPWTVNIHREMETLTKMILTKYGVLGFDDVKFKIACADPAWEVTPMSRVVLSDANDLLLEHYGEAYVTWADRTKWHAMVPADFGLDHNKIKQRIINGRL